MYIIGGQVLHTTNLGNPRSGSRTTRDLLYEDSCCVLFLELSYNEWTLMWQCTIPEILLIFQIISLIILLQDIPPVKAFAPGTYAKRGFLMKLEISHRILGHKKWHRRFCILTRDKLFIYQNEVSSIMMIILGILVIF